MSNLLTHLIPIGAANLKQFMNAGATAPEWAVGIKIGTFTRAQDGASASVAYTGVGFKPSMVIFLAGVAAVVGGSVGFSNGTNHYLSAEATNGTHRFDTTACILTFDAGTWETNATIASLDSDGFTLAWTKAGSSPSGTITVQYLALR